MVVLIFGIRGEKKRFSCTFFKLYEPWHINVNEESCNNYDSIIDPNSQVGKSIHGTSDPIK